MIKSVFFVLLILMLAACGQQQEGLSQRSFVDESAVEGPITMSASGIEVDVAGVCDYQTSQGRLELIFCSERSPFDLTMTPNWQLNGYSFEAEVHQDRITIDILFRDINGIYPADPLAMVGRLELKGQ